MDGLRSWAFTVIATALALAIAEMLLPEGSTRKYAKIAFSLVLMLVVITPVVNTITHKNFKIEDLVQKKTESQLRSDDKNASKDYYVSLLQEYDSKLDAYIIKQVKESGGDCRYVGLKINSDPDNENFGMIEGMEVNLTVGNTDQIRSMLLKEFKLNQSNVIVRMVN